MKSSAYCFYVKTKISLDFQICISVPLRSLEFDTATYITQCDFNPANIYLFDIDCYYRIDSTANSLVFLKY